MLTQFHLQESFVSSVHHVMMKQKGKRYDQRIIENLDKILCPYTKAISWTVVIPDNGEKVKY